MISKIQTIEDVKAFFNHLIKVDKVNFHPDTPFEDYINLTTKAPTFSKQETELMNALMVQSFKVCEALKEDIYEIGSKVYQMPII